MDLYEDGTGQFVFVHERELCQGRHCCVHNPSDHILRKYPTFWDEQRKLMYRLIGAGVRVIDFDELDYQNNHLVDHPNEEGEKFLQANVIVIPDA